MGSYSMGRDLKRFGVECLCLLMVLYGAPLQALQEAAPPPKDETEAKVELDTAPPDPPSSKDDADRDGTVREDTTQSAEAAEAFEAAVVAKDHLEGIPLYPGYNLVSLPEEPPDPDPTAVFAPIAGSYVEVFAHDVCDTTDEDGWQRYDPTDPAASDLLGVDPTQGLWIEATAPTVLPSDGTLPATTSWQLCQGWNLIGFPTAQPRPVRSALQSIDGKYVRIFGYDASDTDDPWEIWDVAVPDWANDLRELRPGFGYWLLVTEDVTLEIANEGEPPQVSFTAPADLAEATAPTEIRGAVESQLLDSWSLAYRFVGETEWSELATGNVPVADGPLATFDPTLLLNGLYELRLRAVDFAGAAVEEKVFQETESADRVFDVDTLDVYEPQGVRLTTRDGRVFDLDLDRGVTRVEDPNGNELEIREEGIFHSAGKSVDFERDAAGRITKITDPAGHDVVYDYDATGDLVSTTDQVGNVTGFAYDADHRLVDVVDPRGVRAVRSEYDSDGRLVRMTDALGQELQLGHDLDARREVVTNRLGQVRVLEYDSRGNILRETDELGHVTTRSYDAKDRLLTETDPLGNTTTNVYDADGYDERDRPVAVTAPEGWTLRYAWDAAGNRTAVTADLGEEGQHTTAYTFDALGRMATVTDARGGVYEYGYDTAGRRSSLSYPNGVVTTYSHDSAGRTVSLHTEALDGTVIQDYAYALGPTGNRQSVTEEDGTVRSWEYDALYRLTRERVTDGDGALVYENAFIYDPVGNRTEQVRTAADGTIETLVYGYDARDRLSSESVTGGASTSYGWDANGNLTSESGSEGTTVYGWDFENRLVSVELPDGTVVGNRYDADGVRMASEVAPAGEATSTTGYFTDTSGSLSQVIAEIDGAGVLGVQYARGDQLLGLLRNGQERYVHADHIGSVRVVTESTGAADALYSYEAFGEILEYGKDEPNAFLFAGEQRDLEADLYYLRARWLSAHSGRFLSVDPWRYLNTEPLTLNRYLYVRANPINSADPSGLFEYTLNGLAAAMAIGATIYGGYSYAITRSFGQAARDATIGALAGATFYASIPFALAALWRVSLLGGGGAAAFVGTTGTTGTVNLYRAMSVAEYRQLLATGRFSAGNGATYQTGKWFAEELPHAIRWGELLARFSRLKASEWVVVEVRVIAPAAQRYLRIESLDGIGPARYAELQQINTALQNVSKVYP